MNIADAICRILRAEGCEIIVGYPVNALLEAGAKAGIRPVIVRQERTAIHMADAMSRLSSGKRLGVTVMQHGPGVENSMGGIAQCYGESVPVLVIPQGYARSLAHVHPNFNAVLSTKSYVKQSEPLNDPKLVEAVMRRAFTALRSGRGGPVLVEVPVDVFAEEAPEIAYRPARHLRSGPDPIVIEEAAALLRSASRPVIYAGQGVHYAQAWSELCELAERLAIPVCTSLEGKSAFNERHALALGAGGRGVPRPLRHFLDRADVILGIGCSFTSTSFGVAMPKGKRIIHATLDARDIDKDTVSEVAIIGDAKLTLAALLESLSAEPVRDSTAVAAEIAGLREEWLAEWHPKARSDKKPLSPYRVLADLESAVDIDHVVITHDAGSPRDQLSPFWRSTTPLSYLGWGKTTQLGYGLGLAMGAKLAHPEKLCINVWGDAAIGFTGMDLETAVRERIPILSVLLNNSSMAIELGRMKVSTERYRATDISGDYAGMMRAFGGHGERVSEPEAILPAIRRAIAKTEEGVPALLEFITEKETEFSTG